MRVRLLRAAVAPVALALDVSADVTGWAAGRLAGWAEATAASLTAYAELARWIETLSRCAP